MVILLKDLVEMFFLKKSSFVIVDIVKMLYIRDLKDCRYCELP